MEDFDFEKNTVRINKSYQRLQGQDVITTPKTPKSNRTIKLPKFLAEEMQEYFAMLYDQTPTDRIFLVTKSFLHHEMERGCKLSGVKKIRIHDLRHSHISHLIDLGFSAVAIADRVGGEEEKSEQEPLRVLGKVENGEIVKAQLPKITCQCLRVPVLNGHTAAVFINFEKKPTKEQLIEKLVSFKGFPQEENLPSAPKQFIQYLEEDNRPQVKLDVDYENGMGVSIGRLREDSMFDFKFVGLSHNTVRGAAGGAVLCAEALTAKGFIQAK